MEREIMMLEDQFPDAAKGIAEFSTPLAHQIIAGHHQFAASLPESPKDTEICLPNWKQDKARQSTPKQS